MLPCPRWLLAQSETSPSHHLPDSLNVQSSRPGSLLTRNLSILLGVHFENGLSKIENRLKTCSHTYLKLKC